MLPCQTKGATPSSGRGVEVKPCSGVRDALADVLAEPRVDRTGVAAPHHEVHAAVGDMLQHGVVLGDLHRIIGGDERRGRREQQLLRLRRDVAEHGGGARGDERRIVVLAECEDVHAHLLDLLGNGQDVLDALVLGGRRSVGGVRRHVSDGEDTELHCFVALSGWRPVDFYAFAYTANDGDTGSIPSSDAP
jgi:hypothetical protein